MEGKECQVESPVEVKEWSLESTWCVKKIALA